MLNTDDRVSLLDAGLPVGLFTTCITLLLVIVPDCDLSVNFAIVDCGWLNLKVYAIKRAEDAEWVRTTEDETLSTNSNLGISIFFGAGPFLILPEPS